MPKRNAPWPPPWPPRRAQPPSPQLPLPLEPSAAELRAELHRIWQGRAYWRLRYPTLQALLACPRRRHLLTVCARQAWRARQRAQHPGPGR